MSDEIPDIPALSLTEIQAAYDPDTWPTAEHWGTSLLGDALRHRDPAAREWLANRLLDDGLDPLADGAPYLHILIHAPQTDADGALLQRLLDAGMDPNKLEGRHGRAAQAVLMENRRDLADIIFAVPGLDLLRQDNHGGSVRSYAQKSRFAQRWFFDRVEAYLAEHGDDVPAPHPGDAAAWAFAEELEEHWDPATVGDASPETGATLLHGVLLNPLLEVRTTWVPRLLEAGADPNARLKDRRTPLHLAFANTGVRKPARDAEGVSALLAAGADPNACGDAKTGTPLNVLGLYSNVPEQEVRPLADALLAAPGFDPLTKVGRTRTAWDLLVKKRQSVPDLVARVAAMVGEE